MLAGVLQLGMSKQSKQHPQVPPGTQVPVMFDLSHLPQVHPGVMSILIRHRHHACLLPLQHTYAQSKWCGGCPETIACLPQIRQLRVMIFPDNPEQPSNKFQVHACL